MGDGETCDECGFQKIATVCMNPGCQRGGDADERPGYESGVRNLVQLSSQGYPTPCVRPVEAKRILSRLASLEAKLSAVDDLVRPLKKLEGIWGAWVGQNDALSNRQNADVSEYWAEVLEALAALEAVQQKQEG